MQYSPIAPLSPPQPLAEQRPFLASFDSGREFTIEHWTEVAVLVERQQDEELQGYVFEDCLVSS
jgi:hypothetical protein